MEMTPMIDVTFLLLIFFLCTIKFKILEGKIPAYLPKDVGVNATPIDKELLKIDIVVVRKAPANVEDKKWVWKESQIDIKIQGKRMKGLADFNAKIEALHYSNPEAKATLYPSPGALYIDCVKVVNECLRAKIVAITFGGTRMDS